MKNPKTVSDLVKQNKVQEFLEVETKEGILVLGLLPNCLAARAGVRKDDRIVSVNGERIYSLQDYITKLNNRSDKVVLEVIREDKNLKFTLDYNPVSNLN